MTDAAVVTSAPTTTQAPPVVVDAPQSDIAKIADLTGDAYAAAKKDYIAKNGEHAWRAEMDGKAPATNGVDKTAEPVKPVTEAAKPNGHAEEAEPGEITIEADGTARETKTGRFVPKEIALRWKSEAKSAKEVNEQLVRSTIAVQERLAGLLEAPKETVKQPVHAESPPDPTEDVFGALSWIVNELKTQKEKLNKTSDTTTAKLENNEMRDRFVTDGQKFSAVEPAFVPAYQYLVKSMDGELEARGYADAAERQLMVARAISNDITRLQKANQSAPEAIFKVAKARGFTPTPPVDPNKEKAEQAQAEIDRINKSKNAATTLSGAGAGGGLEGLTLQKLASLTGDAYGEQRRAYIGRHGEDAWRRLIGG